MKYIMIETIEGQKLPIMFPDTLVHADVAIVMMRLIEMRHKVKNAPINAGFVSIGTDVTVHGESESLDLKSNPVDGFRIIAGEAVSHMPDMLLGPLIAKMKEQG